MENIPSRRTELEELRHQAGQITDESLESTRRMLNMMEESEEAGKQTIEALDMQEEQLRRIEQGMDTINADMTKAEKSLKRLKQCCNVCAIPCKKDPTHAQHRVEHKIETENNCNVIVNQPLRRNSGKTSNSTMATNPSQGYISRITNDAREDEMESNLCQVNSVLDNLRHMATDINTQLGRHNEQIERINTKGNENEIRLDQVNTSASDLLKS